MSTTARQYWLKLLRGVGVKNFRTTSGLGLPFICHVGDFSSEVAFYSRKHSVPEISLMAEWCLTEERPVVFDIGANNGFVATQLAQCVTDRPFQIYAFEPVASTFLQLKFAVDALKLVDKVIPICCAVSDSPGLSSLAYNPRQSLFAQVRNDGLNERVGTQKAVAATLTVDEIFASIGVFPTLMKIDVEGSETRVIAGGRNLLSGPQKPAVCFEWNPLTFSELGADLQNLNELLIGYTLVYIDDFEGQRRPFGQRIEDPTRLEHVCNLFAMPVEECETRWRTVQQATSRRLALNS